MGFLCPGAETCAIVLTSSFHRLYCRLFLLTLLAWLAFSAISPRETEAGQVALAWDAVTATDVAGYKIHYGTTSGNYTQYLDVGNVTGYTVSGLNEGETYYFAAVSYNSIGEQSGYSNEVSKAISATVPTVYTITATATGSGTMTAVNNPNTSTSSSGNSIITSVTVAAGATQIFSIVPNAGYTVTNVVVNGVPVGAVSSYTFSNVNANQSITATFAAVTPTSYTITASAGSGGAISPSGTVTVSAGDSKPFTISPASGYKISDVTVNGVSVGAVSSYTFSNVNANQSITATFAAVTPASYTITASAGSGGAISPSGTVTVSAGGSKPFTISPASGYKISDVTVNGVSVGAVSSYTFSNITANHTISATFVASAISYTITASAGTGGSISPSGTSTVTSGGSQTFTITPATGYKISGVTVDGASVGAVSQYTFGNILNNHAISASFKRQRR